jgi:hypothetical protein
MKIAILNDTHCGIRNSSDVFIENAEKFYTEVFFPYLLENNIKHILHLGDYYDNRKFINFKALNRNRKVFLAKLREYGITMDVTLGNHDTYYKNTNDLNSLKELLGHYMNEVHIITEPSVLEYGELKIGVVPWINPENEKESLRFIENCDAPILGGHFEISGFEVSRGIEHHGGMNPSIFNRFEMVLSGHFHAKSHKGNITYLGSQMEFYWSDAHDPKFFHVLDTTTREIEAIQNPHTLFHRIRYDDSKQDYMEYDLTQVENKFVKIVVINKSDVFTFDRFLDRIQNRKIHELKIQENFSEFVGENVDDENISLEDTTSLVNSYIDGVDTDLNKDRIKNEVYDLYVEAQSIEIA